MIFSQTPGNTAANSAETIPEALRRPITGEAPRYPRDMVIGELGQGTAPDGAWLYARTLASALVAGSRSISGVNDPGLLDKIYASLEIIQPGQYRMGSGRVEEDGTVSFLIRFLGRDKWITGELYLLAAGNNWRLDDLILEEARNTEDAASIYPYDFTPYERFF